MNIPLLNSNYKFLAVNLLVGGAICYRRFDNYKNALKLLNNYTIFIKKELDKQGLDKDAINSDVEKLEVCFNTNSLQNLSNQDSLRSLNNFIEISFGVSDFKVENYVDIDKSVDSLVFKDTVKSVDAQKEKWFKKLLGWDDVKVEERNVHMVYEYAKNTEFSQDAVRRIYREYYIASSFAVLRDIILSHKLNSEYSMELKSNEVLSSRKNLSTAVKSLIPSVICGLASAFLPVSENIKMSIGGLGVVITCAMNYFGAKSPEQSPSI